MKVYILGASKAGEECYKKTNKFCNILGFIDNDNEKWGKYLVEKVEIFSPEILKINKEYDLIIIASMHTEEIAKQLQEMNIDNFIVLPLNAEDIIHPDFKVYIDYSNKAFKFFAKIKRLQLNIENISISEYNKRYLSEKNLSELFLYADFLWNIYKYHGFPNNLLDYGGGSGLLGMFAKYLGVKNVYYIDIYDVSCKDVEMIANELKIYLNDYICGDIDEVIEYSLLSDIYFDAIVSYDVLEYIYDLDNFFKKLPQVCESNCFVSMWSIKESDSLTRNGAEYLIDFDKLKKDIKTFKNVYILPTNKKSSNVIGLCLQDKPYSNILEEYIEEQDKMIYRLNSYYDILIKWMNKKNKDKSISNWLMEKGMDEIIIYGAGEIGQVLYTELIKDNRIKIKYICDNNKNSRYFIDYMEDINIINLNELNSNFKEMKNIIITPIHAYDKIYKSINNDYKHNIINLRTIIEEM